MTDMSLMAWIPIPKRDLLNVDMIVSHLQNLSVCIVIVEVTTLDEGKR